MSFRVRCMCGKLARICSSNEIETGFKQAYCQCTDPMCGHTFVINIEFDHTISPSALTLPEELRKRISSTAPAEQGSLFQHGEAG